MTAAAPRAVFLSYASQDAPAALRICAALRTAGIEVWFDQSELRGGDAWDQKIRQQIRDCALFLPVISANSASRPEGYFRLEWALADERMQRMSRNKVFIVPVCVDATPAPGADVPDSFLRIQWTRLPEGEPPRTFSERIASLLDGGGAPLLPGPLAGAGTAPAGAARTGAGEPAPPAAPRRALLLGGGALAAALLAGLIVWQWHRVSAARGAAASAAAVTSPLAATQKSVAVLPFTDMSEKHDQEYFSDGLAEELIDVLTRVPELRVPARTSSFSFKGRSATVGEIARALGVTHVLEGSVRKSGERLRITAQLVRADNGFHLWSQTYDRDVRDIFAVQDEIAQAVVGQLKITLLGPVGGGPQQTTSTEVHNLYLQALDLGARDTQAALDQAVALYQRALELDPRYAPAWSGLARTHVRRVSQGLDTTGAGFAKATSAATRAIELDPSLPEPYVVLASAHMQYDRDWKAAEAALARVAELDPNNADAEEARGHLAVAVGRMSDALAHLRRSVELDPLNLLHRKYLGRALQWARRPGESLEVLQHALALNAEFPGLHYELGRALLLQGRTADAQQAFAGEGDHSWRLFGMPLGYRVAGRRREAQAALEALLRESPGSEFQVAETYGFFGEADQCFEWLEKARTLHDPGVIYLRRNPLLEPVAGDPRMTAFRERLGMPPVTADD